MYVRQFNKILLFLKLIMRLAMILAKFFLLIEYIYQVHENYSKNNYQTEGLYYIILYYN